MENSVREKQPVFSFYDIRERDNGNLKFNTLEVINIGGKVAQVNMEIEMGLVAYIPKLDLTLRNIISNGKNANYFAHEEWVSHDYLNQVFSVN